MQPVSRSKRASQHGIPGSSHMERPEESRGPVGRGAFVKEVLIMGAAAAMAMIVALCFRYADASTFSASASSAPSMLVVAFAVLGAAAVGVLLRRAGVSQMVSPRRRPVRKPAEEETDDVHDAGVDSFPASDPPSWSPLRVGGPASQLRFGLVPA